MLIIERKFDAVNYPAQTRRCGRGPRGRTLNPISPVLRYAATTAKKLYWRDSR